MKTKTNTKDEINFSKELQELKNLKDEDIDLSDIEEIDFSKNPLYRGKFYKPVKQSVTLRLDADVVEWFKQHYPKYQSAMNQALRGFVIKQG